LLLLHFATMEALELEWFPDQLRELVVSEAEAHPQIRGMILLEGVFDLQDDKIHFVPEEDGWKEVSLEEVEEVEEIEKRKALSSAIVGAAASGSLIFIHIHPSHIAFGKSAASAILSAASFVSKIWDIELPKLRPAREI